MTNQVREIELSKLAAHPDNANRMSKANFVKLVRNIKRSGRYEPIVVRPCPQKAGSFQIINGHHRCRALAELGEKAADCLVWDVDDEQTGILLATLNRLEGKDELGRKLALLKKLGGTIKANELAKLIPHTAEQIRRLTELKEINLKKLSAKVKKESFAEALVFFVNAGQRQIVEKALSIAEPKDKMTKAAKRAAALVRIAECFGR